MSTPRTHAILHKYRGRSDPLELIELYGLSRELECENKTLRAAQKSCEDCDGLTTVQIEELKRDEARLECLVQLGQFHIEHNRHGFPHIMQSDSVIGKGQHLREAIDNAIAAIEAAITQAKGAT